MSEFMTTAFGRGLRVSIREGTTTPLLMMNGIGASLEVLQPFVDAMEPERTIIRFDAPGTGQSPDPVVPYSLAGLSSALSRLLTKLDIEEVDVMGLSWGGHLAQQFAIQSSRCRKLVLIATGTGCSTVPGELKAVSRLLTPKRYHDPEYARKVAGETYGGSMRHNPQCADFLLHSGGGGPSRGYYYQLAATCGWSSIPFLPLIQQPTLVLAGDDDPLIPTVNAKVISKLVPDARLHIYKGGHLTMLTDANDIAPVVDSFLNER